MKKSEVAEKELHNNSYKSKDYTFPSGRIEKYKDMNILC